METATRPRASINTETLKTIYERRSVRRFTGQSVDRQLIEQLIAAGRMAPSALNKQPWKFYVVTNKEMIHELSKEIYREGAKKILKTGVKQVVKTGLQLLTHFAESLHALKSEDVIFHGAPVVIFITGPCYDEWAALDIGMCAENIMLAAKAAGLESCPVGFAKFVTETRLFPQLHIPGTEEVYLSVILGYGAETPSPPERKKNNILFIN